MSNKPGSNNIVMMGVVFVLCWLGLMFIMFPVGNPIEGFHDNSAPVVFYASLFCLIILVIVLIYFAVRTAFKDILQSIGDELGIDVGEVGRDIKNVVVDEVQVLMRKKKKVDDYYVEEKRYEDDAEDESDEKDENPHHY